MSLPPHEWNGILERGLQPACPIPLGDVLINSWWKTSDSWTILILGFKDSTWSIKWSSWHGTEEILETLQCRMEQGKVSFCKNKFNLISSKWEDGLGWSVICLKADICKKLSAFIPLPQGWEAKDAKPSGFSSFILVHSLFRNCTLSGREEKSGEKKW